MKSGGVQFIQLTIDKYGSKYTGSQTNVQAKIGGTYKQIRTDGVYIREGTDTVCIQYGKDMITLRSNDKIYPWHELIFIIYKACLYEGYKN